MRIHITPMYRGTDEGDGGVRRVIEMQVATLPQHGFEIVGTPEEADIILVHILEQSKWLKRYSDKCIVVDCHGLYWAEYEWENWCYKANAGVMETIRQADGVIAHSEWVAQAIRRHTMRQVDVVPGAIDLDDWDVVDRHSGYVLWNKTRPDPICDPEPIVRLAQMMPDKQFVSTFGPMKKDSLKPNTDAIPNLRVIGKLPFNEAKMVIQQAAVYLCTTRETFGIGTLEAMAAGVPVVGWNWGGQREFLEHGKDAWLSEPGDYVQLVNGINWTLDRREELSERVRAIVEERFTSARVGKQLASMLKAVHARWAASRAGPRTSIIVTAYGLEDYLPDTLDSIAAQGDEDWECIIVDDASPDSCGEIADGYAAKDDRFRVIHNTENQYLAGARNTGIDEAKGRYIFPLDADDMIAPSTIGLLASALDADRSVHVAYGNVLFVDEDGETPTNYQTRQGLGHSGWPVEFRYEWQEVERNCLSYASMFRREAWQLTGGYRRRCRTAEDADFWTRLASHGFRPKMVTKADTLIYRNREGSMSREVGGRDWAAWFPWSKDEKLRPAGALADTQPPVPSCDPPIISIIIPVGKGHEELLWYALDSVDAQTFRQWECIVINDTGEPLPRALPSWVIQIIPPANQKHGVAAARNLGIAASRGSLFVPLDADDYLQPDCLNDLFAVYLDNREHVIYSDWYDEASPDDISIYEAPDYDATLLTKKGCIHAVTALYPKSVWSAIGGFDESLPAWEDWGFQLAAAEKGICSVHVPKPLWVYRKHTGYRREENYVEYEASKKGILDKWSRFFNGREELMGCRSCGGKGRQAAPSAATQAALRASQNGDENPGDVVLIEYVGKQRGAKNYRGPSGQRYRFAYGRDGKKLVKKSDAGYFLSMSGFHVVDEPDPTPSETPELVVEGPPVR